MIVKTRIRQSFPPFSPANFEVNVIHLTNLVVAGDLYQRGRDEGRIPMASVQRVLNENDAIKIPLHLCPNCSAYVIAATSSERVSDRRVRNMWSCEACGNEFETLAYF